MMTQTAAAVHELAYRHYGHSSIVDTVLNVVMRALIYLVVYRVFGHLPLGVILAALAVVLFLVQHRRRRHRYR